MKYGLPLFATLLCAFSAVAEDAPPPPVSEASVSLQDCQRLTHHVAQPDVAYEAGYDVRGNPVTPADLEPPLGQIKLPDEIVIDFGVDLAGRYGISGAGLFTATAGILTINYDVALGGLTVNGQPNNPADSQAVAKAGAMMLKNRD